MPPLAKIAQAGQLVRGDACLACRLRKIKCSGTRPRCRRCDLLNLDCNYVGVTPQPGRIAALQSRILELEVQIADLNSSHNRILLSFRIFEQFHLLDVPTVPRNQLVRSLVKPVIQLFPWALPMPPSRSTSKLPGGAWDDPPILPISDSTVPALFVDWHPELGTSVQQSIYLIRVFLPHRAQWCFYFPAHDLLERSVLPTSDPNSIHPALLNVIYLISCSMAGGILLPHVDYWRNQVRIQLKEALAFVDRLTHFIWASIMFGTWLARVGYFNEGYLIITSTVQFALGCGLTSGNNEGNGILPPPETAEDAIERVHLVHALYQMDRNLAVYSSHGGILRSDDRWKNEKGSPISKFQRALTHPGDVWPSVLGTEKAVAKLDSVLLGRTMVSLLHERVELLTNSIFEYNSQDLKSKGLNQTHLTEFHAIRSELATFLHLLPPLAASDTTKVSEVNVNPDLTKLHVTYYGTIIVLYNIVIVLHQVEHEVLGVSLKHARENVIRASDALAHVASLIMEKSVKGKPLEPHAMLFIHFMNAVRIYIREISKTSVRTNTLQLAKYCHSLAALVQLLREMFIRYPKFAHFAASLQRILPKTSSDLAEARLSVSDTILLLPFTPQSAFL